MMAIGITQVLERITAGACEGIAKAAGETWLSNDRIRGIMLAAVRKGIEKGLSKK